MPSKTASEKETGYVANGSPTMVSPTTMISTNDQGWKITIKNADGTSNEVMIEPKAPKADSEDAAVEDDMVSLRSILNSKFYLLTDITRFYPGRTNIHTSPHLPRNSIHVEHHPRNRNHRPHGPHPRQIQRQQKHQRRLARQPRPLTDLSHACRILRQRSC
jgi:hypothetical protein